MFGCSHVVSDGTPLRVLITHAHDAEETLCRFRLKGASVDSRLFVSGFDGEGGDNRVDRIFCVTEEHRSVVLEEQWVLNTRIAGSH